MVTGNRNQNFTCGADSFQAGINVTNVTFSLSNSVPAINTQTFRNLVGATNSTTANETFTVNNLADDTYQWNCLYKDDDTNQNLAANFSLQIKLEITITNNTVLDVLEVTNQEISIFIDNVTNAAEIENAFLHYNNTIFPFTSIVQNPGNIV